MIIALVAKIVPISHLVGRRFYAEVSVTLSWASFLSTQHSEVSITLGWAAFLSMQKWRRFYEA